MSAISGAHMGQAACETMRQLRDTHMQAAEHGLFTNIV